jgi:hypothetical protein
MKTTFLSGLLLILGTFDFAQAEDAGRWIVTPATQNPMINQGSPFVFAWRLDTKTGALEMCTYDPGGWINAAAKMPQPESLNCTPANTPPSR